MDFSRGMADQVGLRMIFFQMFIDRVKVVPCKEGGYDLGQFPEPDRISLNPELLKVVINMFPHGLAPVFFGEFAKDRVFFQYDSVGGVI